VRHEFEISNLKSQMCDRHCPSSHAAPRTPNAPIRSLHSPARYALLDAPCSLLYVHIYIRSRGEISARNLRSSALFSPEVIRSQKLPKFFLSLKMMPILHRCFGWTTAISLPDLPKAVPRSASGRCPVGVQLASGRRPQPLLVLSVVSCQRSEVEGQAPGVS